MRKEQIDRNYGKLGGWLNCVMYDERLLYSTWSWR